MSDSEGTAAIQQAIHYFLLVVCSKVTTSSSCTISQAILFSQKSFSFSKTVETTSHVHFPIIHAIFPMTWKTFQTAKVTFKVVQCHNTINNNQQSEH